MPTTALILFVAAVVAAGAWLLLLPGRRGELADPGRRSRLAAACAIAGLLAMVASIAVIVVDDAGSTTAKGAHGTVELTASERRGAELFGTTCAVCHTLAASRSAGDVGPDLDLIAPPAERTLRVIENGSIGYTAIMPPDLLRDRDARDVAAYVARVARR